MRPVNKTDVAELRAESWPLSAAAAHHPCLLGLTLPRTLAQYFLLLPALFAALVSKYLLTSPRTLAALRAWNEPLGRSAAQGPMAGCGAAMRPGRSRSSRGVPPPQATLHATFGSLSSIMTASREQLSHCPGLGERKVARLLEAFDEPFIPRGAAAALPAAAIGTAGAEAE